MNSIYITSVERYSGKTAVCLALGKRFQADGYKVGYFKPLSLQPWFAAGKVADEDAFFVKEILGLSTQSGDLSPVILTEEMLRQYLRSYVKADLMAKVKSAFEIVSAGQDILIVEGGGSLREGYVVNLPTPLVAESLHSDVIAVIKYRDQVRVLDDSLAAKTRLGNGLRGIVINRVPNESMKFTKELVVPFLENHGIAVLGVLPEKDILASLTVGDLVDVLAAEVLTKYYRPQSLIENMVVGAMTAEAALSRFRKYSRKAVITGGDRTDIQLAALETSTVCLVLTGNLHPSALVVKQAEEFGVTVLLVHANTMETIEKIDTIYGKTRLGDTTKFNLFLSLFEPNVDFDRLYKIIGVPRKNDH